MKRRDRTLAFAAMGAWAAVAGLVACLSVPLPAQAAKDTIVIAIPGRSCASRPRPACFFQGRRPSAGAPDS